MIRVVYPESCGGQFCEIGNEHSGSTHKKRMLLKTE
jgi:hypothetical protein